jgi:hypothetical protein
MHHSQRFDTEKWNAMAAGVHRKLICTTSRKIDKFAHAWETILKQVFA